MVQYVGDANEAEKLPHGNVKDSENARPFIRTIPSVLTRLAEQVSIHKPSLVYKRALTATNDVHELPRNSNQVSNVRQQVNNDKRLSRDSLANLHEVSYDVLNFVQLLKQRPGLHFRPRYV